MPLRADTMDLNMHMNLKNLRLAAAFATASLMAVTVSAHGDKAKDMQKHDMSSMQGHDMKGHSAGSMAMHQVMADGMKMPMKMSGNVDKDFATMMTMHHQQAIKMADVQLKNGTSPELKAMARKIKTMQQAEIKQLAPYTK